MSYTKSFYHIIFRTHHSEMTIEEKYERDLYMYVFVFCKNQDVKLWQINSMPNHIHMLVSLPPNISVASFVKNVKQTAGNYIKAHRRDFPMFDGWADGYCSLTYCERELDAVIRYIKNQKAHHKGVNFADEMRKILEEAGIDVEPTYFHKDWEE